MRIKGLDINRAQENINFDKIEKSGAKFVILRAGIRTDTDTYFQYYLDAVSYTHLTLPTTPYV